LLAAGSRSVGSVYQHGYDTVLVAIHSPAASATTKPQPPRAKPLLASGFRAAGLVWQSGGGIVIVAIR
jgi:hypothetical protein